jgi:hypothetical protein
MGDCLMGNVRLYGSTSGYTELAPPAVAPDGVLSLPSGTGTLLTAEGGKVLQVVRATDSTLRSTTSLSFVDVTGMSVTITPQKNTSAILVLSIFEATVLDLGGTGVRGIFQITNSSNSPISGAEYHQVGMLRFTVGASPRFWSPVSLVGYATPATTSATTYKLRFSGIDSGTTVQADNSTATGQMYAIEVSA